MHAIGDVREWIEGKTFQKTKTKQRKPAVLLKGVLQNGSKRVPFGARPLEAILTPKLPQARDQVAHRSYEAPKEFGGEGAASLRAGKTTICSFSRDDGSSVDAGPSKTDFIRSTMLVEVFGEWASNTPEGGAERTLINVNATAGLCSSRFDGKMLRRLVIGSAASTEEAEILHAWRPGFLNAWVLPIETFAGF